MFLVDIFYTISTNDYYNIDLNLCKEVDLQRLLRTVIPLVCITNEHKVIVEMQLLMVWFLQRKLFFVKLTLSYESPVLQRKG